MIIKSSSVVSIKTARELLGDEAIIMSDTQVQDLIDNFDLIAQYTIKLVQKFDKKNNKTD